MTGIDKQSLYGKFQEGEERQRTRQDQREGLYLKAAHKALDIPQDDEEEMGVHTSQVTNNNGVSPLVMAGLIGMSVLGTGGMSYFLSHKDIAPPLPIAPVVAPVEPSTDADTKYEFRISSGKPKGKPKGKE